jgi:hypothetical protein
MSEVVHRPNCNPADRAIGTGWTLSRVMCRCPSAVAGSHHAEMCRSCGVELAVRDCEDPTLRVRDRMPSYGCGPSIA